jgi:hypothetical protein
VHVVERSVTVSLGDDNVMTVGDLTAKNTDKGYGGIQWLSLAEEGDYGRLPAIRSLGLGDTHKDREEDTSEDIQAVLTLSASYLSFPAAVLEKAIIGKLGAEAVCKVNSQRHLECSSASKKKLERLLEKDLVVGFEGGNMVLPLKGLVLRLDHGRRAVFNIKQSLNSYAILGEPVFQQYYLAFDYLGNRIGFSDKRQQPDEFLFEIVALVRFLCSVMVCGTHPFTQVAASSAATNPASDSVSGPEGSSVTSGGSAGGIERPVMEPPSPAATTPSRAGTTWTWKIASRNGRLRRLCSTTENE